MNPVLDVAELGASLAKPRPRRLVDSVSFVVHQGSATAIVGESGSGKTLTALALMGLQPPGVNTTGRALLEGKNLLSLRETEHQQLRGSAISMVFEDPRGALNPFSTVFSLVAAPLRAQGTARGEIRERVERSLFDVGMAGQSRAVLSKYPHQLSEGDCQRVLLAMAQVGRPRILILDEPTTALDAPSRATVATMLETRKAEGQLGLLLISHDLDLVLRTADLLVIMYAGQVVESGQCRHVFDAPAHPYTRGLLSSRVPEVFTGAPETRRLPTIPGSIERDHSSMGCAFRLRCAYRQSQPAGFERCDSERPELVPLIDGQAARCHFAEELA